MGPRLEHSSFTATVKWLSDFDLTMPQAHFRARFNIAPLTAVWAVYSTFGRARLSPAEWALIPPWAKLDQFPRPLTVARAETVWQRASYKNLIRRYRCLLPVNGFYLWSKQAGGQPQPWHVANRDAPIIGLAGLYQYNADGNMQIVLITTTRSVARPDINDRMPVIVAAESYDKWFNSERQEVIDDLLAVAPPDLHFQRVGSAVNDLRTDSALCSAPLDP